MWLGLVVISSGALESGKFVGKEWVRGGGCGSNNQNPRPSSTQKRTQPPPLPIHIPGWGCGDVHGCGARCRRTQRPEWLWSSLSPNSVGMWSSLSPNSAAGVVRPEEPEDRGAILPLSASAHSLAASTSVTV